MSGPCRCHLEIVRRCKARLRYRWAGLYTANPYGRPVPMCDLMFATSPALMAPLAFTSERKFVPSSTCPIRDLVCATSPEFTAPLPLVSPMSTPICTLTSPVVIPSLTPVNVTVIRWALLTPVRLTVTVVLPLPLLLLTDPAPDVTDALVKVTELPKVKTTW